MKNTNMTLSLKHAKGNFDRMFDRSLASMIRGIRQNKDGEAKFISQCVEEIKIELKQDSIGVKVNAVSKLLYLRMLGSDISWAAFNIIEVMNSSKFANKRIGYLTASQSFHVELDILLLTSNMIRKDLNSPNLYDAGNALSALACFVSPDLAKDLANDVLSTLNSTKPYLRKKGVLMLYKVFLRYPESLRPSFPLLKTKLEDPDPGVQSAAVNVLCELAKKNPKNYLSLAPILFRLMSTSHNNWMLIKIIKLLGVLTPLEPRLGKKLIEPLTNLIHHTTAMSLLYECISTTIAVLISNSAGMPDHNSSIQLCVRKLRHLLEDSDQNLKYLGLLALSKIIPSHPKSVQMHKDQVMRCLEDKDESIRLRALDLLYGIVNSKNLMEIVKKLLVHMEKVEGTTYRDQLLQQIIRISSQNNYQHINNFEWYLSVLVELSRVEGLNGGDLICGQLMDVTIRVKAIRPFAVQQMSYLLENPFVIFGDGECKSAVPKMNQVLYAAAWICGEYCNYLPDARRTLLSLLDGRVVQLPHNIQAAYLQNCLKILSHVLCNPGSEQSTDTVKKELEPEPEPETAASDLSVNLLIDIDPDNADETKSDPSLPIVSSPTLETTRDETELDKNEQFTIKIIKTENKSEDLPPKSKSLTFWTQINKDLEEIQAKLKPFISSEELEVQERASNLFIIIKYFFKLKSKGEWDAESFGSELSLIFAGDLNPVAPKAQKKVPLPEGLDLDAWINDAPLESDEDVEKVGNSNRGDAKMSIFPNLTKSPFYGMEMASEAFPGYQTTFQQPTEEELFQQSEARRLEHELNPHYLKTGSKVTPWDQSSSKLELITDYVKKGKKLLSSIPGFKSSDSYLADAKLAKESSTSDRKSRSKGKGHKKIRQAKKRPHDDITFLSPERKSESETLKSSRAAIVNTAIEIPEGATLSDTEDSNLPKDDPHRALNIDLDSPLNPSEMLPIRSHRSLLGDSSRNLKSELNPREQHQASSSHKNEKGGSKATKVEPKTSKSKSSTRKFKKDDEERSKEKHRRKGRGSKKSKKRSPSVSSKANLLIDSCEEMDDCGVGIGGGFPLNSWS